MLIFCSQALALVVAPAEEFGQLQTRYMAFDSMHFVGKYSFRLESTLRYY